MTVPTPDRPDWLENFSIPAGASGAVLALDFGDDGLWAARLAPDLTVTQTVSEPRITPTVLDVRIAGYLRDSEAVPGAADPENFTELLDLCRRARDTLVERDSVLLMGTGRLRLVPVTLDTVMAATVPEVNRAHGLIAELAGREPVAAVFLGPGTDGWPGLWESLTDRGFSMLLPGDPFPPTFAGDDDTTHAFEAVAPEPSSLAWAAAPAAEEPAARNRNPRRGKVILTVAALSIIAVGGVGVAAATLLGDDHPTPSTLSTATADETAEEVADGDTPAAAPPSELRAARATMKRYTPPPSPTATSTPTQTTEAPLGPRPRPTTRPDTRRTLPNPIPGLPPIVIG